MSRNPISIAGVWITTLSVCAFVTYMVIDGLGLLASPYAGLFGFMVVPAFFGLGLVLIPIGIWVEARRRPSACVSARMTARSCVLLPRHPDEVTTVVPRRRGNEAISMFHLPKPGRLILKSEHGRKSVSAGRYMPAERRRSTGEPHRRRLPTAASRGGGRFAPGKDLNCAFRVGMAGILLVGL